MGSGSFKVSPPSGALSGWSSTASHKPPLRSLKDLPMSWGGPHLRGWWGTVGQEVGFEMTPPAPHPSSTGPCKAEHSIIWAQFLLAL